MQFLVLKNYQTTDINFFLFHLKIFQVYYDLHPFAICDLKLRFMFVYKEYYEAKVNLLKYPYFIDCNGIWIFH